MNIKNYFKHIFSLDALVNIVIGFIFLFLSEKAEVFIFGGRVFPHYVWIVIGAGFLYFAYWQIRSMAKGKMEKKALIFALVMEWAPAFAVTLILIIPVLSLAVNGRLILVIGDIYMMLLGAYYLWLIRDTPGSSKAHSNETDEK